MSKQFQTWSVVIFCYNEEGTVREVIEATFDVLNQISPEHYEVIFVDDGSSDNSFAIAKELQKNYFNLILRQHKFNKGIGYALKTGYELARYENVINISADNQFDIKELLHHPVIPSKTILSFYRREKTGYSFFKHCISFINRMINLIFHGVNIQDVNWINAYKNEELKNLDLKLNSLLVESEICCKLIKNGALLIEVPSIYHKRKSGKGKAASSKIVSQAFCDILKLILLK